MWSYDKKLQYPIDIKNPNPAMAKIIMTQLGGPDGESGAAMRYLHQRYACPYDKVTGTLTDIGSDVLKLHIGPGFPFIMRVSGLGFLGDTDVPKLHLPLPARANRHFVGRRFR